MLLTQIKNSWGRQSWGTNQIPTSICVPRYCDWHFLKRSVSLSWHLGMVLFESHRCTIYRIDIIHLRRVLPLMQNIYSPRFSLLYPSQIPLVWIAVIWSDQFPRSISMSVARDIILSCSYPNKSTNLSCLCAIYADLILPYKKSGSFF